MGADMAAVFLWALRLDANRNFMEAAGIESGQDFNRWRRLFAQLLASHEPDSLFPSHLSTLFEDS